MKLIYRITKKVSVAILILLAMWASLFYFIIMDEINDETDDALEDYSEYLITRKLAGGTLPSSDNGTNNSYHITEVSAQYASVNSGIQYSDSMVYIDSKGETEPARILKTIFADSDKKYYELTVSIPTIEKEDLRETILYWIIFLYIILLLAIICINAYVMHSSFRPLYILLRWLGQPNIGKDTTPLQNNTNVTEFRKLNEAIIKNAQLNTELYEQQKLFIGHASHELQTPLAICQNRLEMLLEDTELNQKQMEEIFKVQQTLSHLIKLNKTLLLLSKIENKQFTEVLEINVNDLVAGSLEDLQEIYGYRNISVSVIEDDKLIININKELSSILFNNLLKNAFVHNNDNGTIEIKISSSAFTITNTGIPKPLDKDKLFKEFQGSKRQGSTGLGLALTRSICKLYEMRISYNYISEKHTFTVTTLR